MTDKDMGGPAFPFEYTNNTSRHQKSLAGDHMVSPGGAEQYAGLTVRDYFAAKAMQGVCASAIEGQEVDHRMCSEWAYGMADAMLAERSKK